MEGTGDMIVGRATGYLDRTGTLAVTIADGRRCTGTFIYASNSDGDGTLACQDGATGTFVFNSTGRTGTGFGATSKGERFQFVFGNQAAIDLKQ